MLRRVTWWLVGRLRLWESQQEQHNISVFSEGGSVLHHDGDYWKRSKFLGEGYRFILGEVEFEVFMGLKVDKTQSQCVYMSLSFKAANFTLRVELGCLRNRDKGLTYLKWLMKSTLSKSQRVPSRRIMENSNIYRTAREQGKRGLEWMERVCAGRRKGRLDRMWTWCLEPEGCMG